jgi:uncharacterized protein YjbJ (UPF0337 family)
MINQQILQGNWKEIQGKLKSKWGALTDDDVKEFDGNVEQLVGRLQKKTGAGRESIEQFFDQFNSNGASTLNRASEAVRGYAHQATEAVQETSQQALDSVREGYAEVEDRVRQSPGQALAYCFGAGVITGVVIHWFFRWR